MLLSFGEISEEQLGVRYSQGRGVSEQKTKEKSLTSRNAVCDRQGQAEMLSSSRVTDHPHAPETSQLRQNIIA